MISVDVAADAGYCRNCGWLSNAESRRGTVVLYHEAIGKPEHRAETLSCTELSTNGVHGVTEWWVLTSWPRILAVRQHSIQTVTVFGGHQTQHLKLNYS